MLLCVVCALVNILSMSQVPALLGDVNDPMAALAGGVACLTALVAYCGYQVAVPELQRRKLVVARGRRYACDLQQCCAHGHDGIVWFVEQASEL